MNNILTVKITNARKSWWYENFSGKIYEVRALKYGEKRQGEIPSNIKAGELLRCIKTGDMILKEDVEFLDDLTEDTKLRIKKDLITPYHSIIKTNYATIKFWASTLGVSTQKLIEDVKSGRLNHWFDIEDEEVNITLKAKQDK